MRERAEAMDLAGITKCRRVCCDTRARRFSTEGAEGAVSLTVEELESLRLCDLEGADQSAAAQSMGVSRGTLQRIVYSARRKVADALCSGKAIHIGGGNFSPAERRAREMLALPLRARRLRNFRYRGKFGNGG